MPNELTSFDQDDYKIVSRDVLYEGMFRMVNYKLKYKQFDGDWSDIVDREVMERYSAAAILPYDPVRDEVILIEQFRVGALQMHDGPWVIETVAGVYHGEETPENTAIKEANEEAGCEILDLKPICEYLVSPGGCNEYLHLYCGHIDATHAGGIYGLAEEHEDIRAFALSADDAFNLLRKGQIKTSPAIISLQWLQLNREWLRDLWQKK